MKRTMMQLAALVASWALVGGCSNKTGGGGGGGAAGSGGGGAAGSGGGGGGSGGTGGTGGGGGGGTGGSGGGGGAASSDMAVAGGPGSVTGTIGGNPFGDVKTAWMIGMPDANAQGQHDTAVIYIFNADVSCHDMAAMFGQMAWDSRIPASTQFLELKEYGPTSGTTPPIAPGAFTVVNPGPTTTPSPGQSTCNHSLTHGATAATEIAASSGTVTVDSIVASTSVKGSFTLHFGADTLTGTFNAGYCDIGVEP